MAQKEYDLSSRINPQTGQVEIIRVYPDGRVQSLNSVMEGVQGNADAQSARTRSYIPGLPNEAPRAGGGAPPRMATPSGPAQSGGGPGTRRESPRIESTGPATDSFGRIVDLLQNELGNTNAINTRLTDPDYINQLRDADAGRRREEADYLANIGMAKMRENTVRQRELATIDAWQNITRAQFDKEAKLGAALTQAAYLANTPNAGVMSSINSIANTSAQGFRAGGSVL